MVIVKREDVWMKRVLPQGHFYSGMERTQILVKVYKLIERHRTLDDFFFFWSCVWRTWVWIIAGGWVDPTCFVTSRSYLRWEAHDALIWLYRREEHQGSFLEEITLDLWIRVFIDRTKRDRKSIWKLLCTTWQWTQRFMGAQCEEKVMLRSHP